MSISGIPSSIFSPSQSTSASNPIQQQFQQLGQSLQTGNLSSAQSAFATLQQEFSQSISNSGASSTPGSTAAGSSAIAQTFNQLASDLQSGNLTAAQKDYSSIQQDFRAKGGPERNHLHNHYRGNTGGLGSEPTSATGSPIQNTLLQDFSQASQGVSSTTSAGAQQAYATLQQALQQFALGGNLSEQASVLSAQPAVSLEA